MRRWLVEVRQDALNHQCALPVVNEEPKEIIIMNAKLLFTATLAVSALSLVSTVAMAEGDTGPRTRAEVQGQAGRGDALARGELYGQSTSTVAPVSTLRRADVIAAANADRLSRPYGSNVGERSSEPAWFAAPSSSTLARAEVKADVRHAIADGTLPRNGEGYSGRIDGTANPSRAARPHLALATK